MLTQPADPSPRAPRVEPPSRSEASGAQLLLTDASTMWIVLNGVRRRAIVRTLGVSPGDADLVTVIGLVLLGGSIHQACGRLVRRSVPTMADSVITAGVARSLLGSIAGPAVDETPGLVGLIAFALVVHSARPTVTKSVHAVRSGWHRCALEFQDRYGPRASSRAR